MPDKVFQDTGDSHFQDTQDAAWVKLMIQAAGGVRVFDLDNERRVFKFDNERRVLKID